MKNLLITVCVLGLASGILGAEKKRPSQLVKADTVAWVGLDYSMVRMVGPADFRNADAIFPAMLDNWNVVFFDAKAREVLRCDRHVGRAAGGGFRNYWFRVIKEADETLTKYR